MRDDAGAIQAQVIGMKLYGRGLAYRVHMAVLCYSRESSISWISMSLMVCYMFVSYDWIDLQVLVFLLLRPFRNCLTCKSS